MSTFVCPIVRVVSIEVIPGADQIELAVVGDYRSVVLRGQYKAGDMATYLPEQAILPDALIEKLGLVGKLSGSAKNRIKAIKLRGCLSQGILTAPVAGLREGECAALSLGVTKWEPTIPSSMGGTLSVGRGLSFHPGLPIKFDIENFKAHPQMIADGEMVELTEKIHGTFCGISIYPGLNDPALPDADVMIYSKGQGAKGLVFQTVKVDNRPWTTRMIERLTEIFQSAFGIPPAIRNPRSIGDNVYVRTIMGADILEMIKDIFPRQTVHVLGEIYGEGVQDLNYGVNVPTFRLFEIYVGPAGAGRYLNRDDIAKAAAAMRLERVPVLYQGPFSRATLYKHTDGKTIAGGGAHIREGCVVTPMVERRTDRGQRVILKSVSGDYLTRKGENVTEYA